MKPYELVVLLHPDLEIDLDKPLKKVETIVKQAGGSVSETDIWGKRKLAYPIGSEDFAVYVFYSVEIPADSVGKLENDLNITDEVLRYLLTHPVPKSERDEKNNDDEPEDAGSKEE